MLYDHDVIIVGGSIAGAALGKFLAKNGVDVAILERELAFRDRVRGEYTHPWGVTEAHKLGLFELMLQTCGYEAHYRTNHVKGLPAKRRDMVATSPHQVGSMHFYHPAMQQVLLDAARQAGAIVRHGQVLQVVPGTPPAVRARLGDGEHTYHARLVVGADGRNSNGRKWMGFISQQDPDQMVIGGVLFDQLDAPEDEVNYFINPESSRFAAYAPLGSKRFRSYTGFFQREGYRRWSGEKDVKEYIAASVTAGAPEEWFSNVIVSGPLASFNCADTWVEQPYKPGLALIGDAAAISDPTYGCGLSLALRDARILGELLLSKGDWDNAGDAYATEHDRYFGSIHRQIDWLTKLFYVPGEVAALRREKAFTRIQEDPRRLPDLPGLGPEGPSDEEAYYNLFGEEIAVSSWQFADSN